MSKSRHKVLMVVEAAAAGVGRHVTDLLSGIDTERFDVTLAWSPVRADARFRTLLQGLKQRGIRTVDIEMVRAANPVADIRALTALIRLMRAERFDVIHGHSSKAGFLARLAARIVSPSSHTVYTPNAIAISVNRFYWYPEKAAGWFTDALVSVTDSEREELESYRLIPTSRIRTIASGIAAVEVIPGLRGRVRAEFGIPDDATVVGAIGRLSTQKDPATFLAVAERVLKSASGIHFLWFGDGELLVPMREQAVGKGIADRVHFAGYRADAQSALDAADIFLITSIYESFGYVTCEAMSLGKAVVGTRVTGTSEVVAEGITGLMEAAGDVSGLASSLLRLVHDKPLRLRLGENGRKRVSDVYALDRMVRETEQLYLDLLSGEAAGCAGNAALTLETR